MTAQEERELFHRLNSGQFDAWLDGQYQSSIKYLISATDTVAINRAQGRAQFIDEIKKLLIAYK